jgi:uncharacterized protein YcsI (UPF0317 family)
MTSWEIKYQVLEVITNRLVFAYKINDVQASKVSELQIKSTYSGISAIQLGNYLRSLPQSLQDDFVNFQSGNNSNSYALAVIAALNTMEKYRIRTKSDMKLMMKAKP